MKVALAQFIYESNTFNPAEAGLGLFTEGGTWMTGPDTVRAWCRGADSQLAGSLAMLEAAGAETVPVWAALGGTPAGRLSAECFAKIRRTLLDSLRAALPADALLLHLHGAVCAAGEDDVEGNLLEAVRKELGFTGRLVVSLDLHANVTPRMLAHADAFTAYRTMPHLDFRETGARAARLVLRPGATVRTLAKIPVLIPPTATTHVAGSFADILARARELEKQPGLLDVGVYPVQPWLDIAGLGSAVVITSTPEARAGAAAAAQALATTWFAQRQSWPTGVQSWDEIRAKLRTRGPRPWILVDSGDATTGGSPGDSAEAVARLWDLRDALPGEVLLWVVDPAAVVAAESGARKFRLGSQGFAVEAEVIFTGEGRYRARGQAYTGLEFSMGRAAVLRAGQLRIVVSGRGALGADPAFYECVGLRPDAAHAVQVKSLMGWRAGYAAEAAQGLVFDGPGCTRLDFARLAFTGERRQLSPLRDAPPNPVSPWQST